MNVTASLRIQSSLQNLHHHVKAAEVLLVLISIIKIRAVDRF